MVVNLVWYVMQQGMKHSTTCGTETENNYRHTLEQSNVFIIIILFLILVAY